MDKVCSKHGLTPFSEGARKRCRKCLVEMVDRRRKELKRKAIEYKGGCCSRCGYEKYAGALEFHHIDPNEKDFHLGQNGHSRSWERIRTELDKCILVCSNCHKEIHYELLLSKREGF